MQSTSGNIIAFPEPRKRGRKSRTGPCAEVVTLPVPDTIEAYRSATSDVDRLTALMEWAYQEYGRKPPHPDVMVDRLRSIGALDGVVWNG
ncbi:MAG TPA: hypothetical protein VMA74_04955 [Dyella sp.]|uniref:hypothetical protein n=1 Tax=Dyella sp. TaxID=1869338 RepID=UPI002C7C7FA6|nr:hypothetical protein [Dyella sp.]HUB89063.1 hypothetical protein [Dyella sp.]